MTILNDIYPAEGVSLREVGLRDGLQLVQSIPSTEAKKSWISQEYAAGVRHFEVGSFLSPEKYPMFADVTEMIAFVDQLPGAHSAALCLNKRGVMDALQTSVGEVSYVISATEEHNQANLNRSRADTLLDIRTLCRLRDGSENKPLVSVGIAMSFGCSLAGAVPPEDVLELAEACYSTGVDIVSLADTVGYAGPQQVTEMIRTLHDRVGNKPVGIHLHDTRGLGLANAATALGEGVRILDGALGGLGGCPFAPNATGNIVFEDLVFLAQTYGFAKEINIEALVKIRQLMAEEMPTEILYGAMAKAGLPLSSEPV